MLPRKDIVKLCFLLAIAFAIYYPVFYSDYLYTDEAVQLWLYKKDSGFHMFNGQGRHITDWLFHQLFDRADTVRELRSIRLFAFFGWLASIIIWYAVLRRVTIKESLPNWLPFILTLFLIGSPTFAISIGWASCCELFIAYTAGLLSGYLLYIGFRYEEGRVVLPFKYILASVILGLISLFTYQNGIGCFLLPFLMSFLARPGEWKKPVIGLAGYLLTALIYFALFKYLVKISGVDQLSRTEMHLNPLNKLFFFFSKPLSSAVHLNYLITEDKKIGVIVSMILLAICLALYFIKLNVKNPARIKQISLLIVIWMMIYLPSLLVKENYASNRTMLALSMGVWLFLIVLVSKLVSSGRKQILVLVAFGTVFFVNAYYNFHFQFLKPVQKEYSAMRKLVDDNFITGIDSFHVIRPQENMFVRKYGITRSWDEFGVPSLFFEWTPEFFVRQVVFEKTGDLNLAEKLVIKTTLSTGEQNNTTGTRSGNVVYLNAASQ